MVRQHDEREHERAVKQFFADQVEAGRISADEVRDLNGDGGRQQPKEFNTYKDFIGKLSPMDRERVLTALYDHALDRTDVEIWINYPAWTESELGSRLGYDRTSIARRLAKIRTTWPQLRRELPVRARDECPALRNMDRIETTDKTDWLDIETVRERF